MKKKFYNLGPGSNTSFILSSECKAVQADKKDGYPLKIEVQFEAFIAFFSGKETKVNPMSFRGRRQTDLLCCGPGSWLADHVSDCEVVEQESVIDRQ